MWCKLGDIILLTYGKAIKKEDIGGDIQAYGANGVLKYVKMPYVTNRCIIVGRKGSTGALNIVKEPFWPSDITYYVLYTSNLDFLYIFYLLKSLNLGNLSFGTKPGLNRNIALSLNKTNCSQSRFINDIM